MTSGIKNRDYKSYDYKRVIINEEQESFCIDCYENLGWFPDENKPAQSKRGQLLLWFKRDKQIINKMELTRLEQHFDACLAELDAMERSKYVRPTVVSAICGLLGTVFMAGSVFAVTATPPVVWLCILLAIPGFLGWILPYFIYHREVARRTEELAPFIDAKYDAIDKICEKGHSLL